MNIEQYLPRLTGYAKFLSRYDYEDLVQDTIERYLRNKHQYAISEALLNTICKNIWKDNFKSIKEILTDNMEELCNLYVYPEAEVNIYCREMNIDLYEFEEKKKYSRERDHKAKERMRKLYYKRKQCSLQLN